MEKPMKPTLNFLETNLVEKIINEARDILCKLGMEIHNDKIVSMLCDHGAIVNDDNRVIITNDIIDKALSTVPKGFSLYDSQGEKAVELSGHNVNFTPGSAAINLLEYPGNKCRRPLTSDYISYAKLMCSMDHIASQSTCMVPFDVHEGISDSYRLYLSLMYCQKPVVTGAFSIDAFNVMLDLQLAIRGNKENLKDKPLTIFSCCPTAPLKWSDVTSQNLVDCANNFIPAELISMPLTGFVAPVTLVGTVIQHTVETLSGVVISQLTQPGTPLLYGGSPAIFDIRYETTPMGDIGTMMVDCAYNEIGKYLGIPTQAYIGLSDAKLFDAQAGSETAMGITMAALAGINNISGPGMMDFESCFSLEKLVLDNEMCGMALRMIKGIEPKDDFNSIERFQELIKEQHLLISDHTQKYLKEEIFFTGEAIDRTNRSRWKEEGETTIAERAHAQIEKSLHEYEPIELDEDIKKELTNLMTAESKKFNMDKLPL
jgi:trimethylamine--corrinoid protein Co-methyltransferase